MRIKKAISLFVSCKRHVHNNVHRIKTRAQRSYDEISNYGTLFERDNIRNGSFYVVCSMLITGSETIAIRSTDRQQRVDKKIESR